VLLLRDKNLFLSVFAFKPKKAKIATKANSNKRQKVTKAKRKNPKSKKSQIFTAKLAKNVSKQNVRKSLLCRCTFM